MVNTKILAAKPFLWRRADEEPGAKADAPFILGQQAGEIVGAGCCTRADGTG